MTWTFQLGDLDAADVRVLLALHADSMLASSPPDACHVLGADRLGDAAITFWSLREAGRLIGIGALKEIEPRHGEVKSMRTAPGALGRGVGTALLHHIVGEARRRGYRRLSLETGSTGAFAAALRLYAREGFEPCDPFGGYKATAFTRFMTRSL